jgi:hypothetical protein
MQKKNFKIADALRQIKFNAEYALNSLDHYSYGDVSAKKRVQDQVQTMIERMNIIDKELLTDFLFKDE